MRSAIFSLLGGGRSGKAAVVASDALPALLGDECERLLGVKQIVLSMEAGESCICMEAGESWRTAPPAEAGRRAAVLLRGSAPPEGDGVKGDAAATAAAAATGAGTGIPFTACDDEAWVAGEYEGRCETGAW